MTIHSDLAAAVGNTPLIRLRGPSDATGCEILGKAEFLNPGQSVKDRAALWIIRDAVASGRLRARRHHRRGHRRQHRHRAGAGRRLDGVSHRHRHPRHPEPGEEGHDPAGGCCARRGARGALSQPRQLRALLRAPRRGAGRLRAERRDLGQPVRQHRQPAGPCRGHGARDPARTARRWTASSAPWGRGARSRAWPRGSGPRGPT